MQSVPPSLTSPHCAASFLERMLKHHFPDSYRHASSIKHWYPCVHVSSKASVRSWSLQVKTHPVIRLPKEQLVDTNGAGDAFVGGYLAKVCSVVGSECCVMKLPFRFQTSGWMASCRWSGGFSRLVAERVVAKSPAFLHQIVHVDMLLSVCFPLRCSWLRARAQRRACGPATSPPTPSSSGQAALSQRSAASSRRSSTADFFAPARQNCELICDSSQH